MTGYLGFSQSSELQFSSVAQSCLTLCDPMDSSMPGLPVHFSSVQWLSRVWLFVTPWTAACQASCLSPTPRTNSNSCSLSQWYHPTIWSSVISFSSCPQSFPASGSFQMSQLFASGCQSIGVSASTSVLSSLIAMTSTQYVPDKSTTVKVFHYWTS